MNRRDAVRFLLAIPSFHLLGRTTEVGSNTLIRAEAGSDSDRANDVNVYRIGLVDADERPSPIAKIYCVLSIISSKMELWNYAGFVNLLAGEFQQSQCNRLDTVVWIPMSAEALTRSKVWRGGVGSILTADASPAAAVQLEQEILRFAEWGMWPCVTWVGPDACGQAVRDVVMKHRRKACLQEIGPIVNRSGRPILQDTSSRAIAHLQAMLWPTWCYQGFGAIDPADVIRIVQCDALNILIVAGQSREAVLEDLRDQIPKQWSVKKVFITCHMPKGYFSMYFMGDVLETICGRTSKHDPDLILGHYDSPNQNDPWKVYVTFDAPFK